MGKVIKDFDTLEEKSFITGKLRKGLLLVERRGKLKIVFQWSGFAPFGASVHYFDLSVEYLPKLLQFMGEIQTLANRRNSNPISPP